MTKTKPTTTRPRTPFSPEVRERAVRLVREQQDAYATEWAAIRSIAEKIGCTGETLRLWVRQAERDAGRRPGIATDERASVDTQIRPPVDTFYVVATPVKGRSVLDR